MTQRKIKKHTAVFKNDKNAGKWLRLADTFLESHPEILYWTERNSTKKGLFYVYGSGLYSVVSTLEVEQMLVDFKPEDNSISIPSLISQAKHQETMHNIMRRRFFYRDRFNPEGIINFRNGFFDIETGELGEHSMDVISTNQLPYNYDSEAKCPNFLKALNDAVEGDVKKIRIIQEFVGYCLTRETKYEKALFLIGAASSGKSTVLDGIEAMLGKENVSNTSMEQLCQPRYAGNFIDKIANIDREIPRDISGYEEALKKIITGEAVKVDTKFIPSYDARPYCKVIFSANDMPRIADTSNALFRRMLLIEFNNVIPNHKVDVDLKERAKTEGAGIFNWALLGLKRLNENKKFTASQEMEDSIRELKMQNNSTYYFITECYNIEQGNEVYVTMSDLYEKYKEFCHKIGAKGIFKKITFSKEVRKTFGKDIETGQVRIDGVNHRVWLGMIEKPLYEQNEQVEWGD